MNREKRDSFLFVVFFVWVFSFTLLFLNSIGYVPYYVDGTVPTYAASPEDSSPTETVYPGSEIVEHSPELQNIHQTYLPERLIIPSLQKDLLVSNPTSNSVEVLDRALLTSVVRYPGSGLLGEDGNIFIFGHSTGYRTVNNALFKAFNGIQNLKEGALITLIAGKKTFLYQVESVVTVDAETALIDITKETDVRKLTLSTCDSFGKKTARFVVTAAELSSFENDTNSPGGY